MFLALAALLVGRALGWGALRWPIRAGLVAASYLWWTAEAWMRSWGTGKFAPLQLQLSDVNALLLKLGQEELRLYDPVLWRELGPELGWQVAGASLLGIALHTVWDGPRRRNCKGCGRAAPLEDAHCGGCGERFPQVPACGQCGASPQTGDRFCRRCGSSLAEGESNPGRPGDGQPSKGPLSALP